MTLYSVLYNSSLWSRWFCDVDGSSIDCEKKMLVLLHWVSWKHWNCSGPSAAGNIVCFVDRIVDAALCCSALERSYTCRASSERCPVLSWTFQSTSSSKTVICLVSSNSHNKLLILLQCCCTHCFHHVLQTVFPSGTAMASWVARIDLFLFGPVSEVTQCPVGASVSVLSVLGVKPLRVLRILHYI